ncbi:HAD family phosphatase [Candidatus Woesearchaeota archaeon]|nr:HAD family phosphatase [Candidatus Woesearchaeota archaeon]
MKNNKIKLIFFDMEGVITETGIVEKGKNTAASAWTLISRHLGRKAGEEEQATKDKWNRSGYKNYIEWMEDTIRIHKKYGLTMRYFYKVLRSIPYMKGAKQTFSVLHKKGYKTALITGGFKNQANKIQRELKIDHVFAACEYFFDDKTRKLTAWNLLPADYVGKVDFMRLLMREYGLAKEECAFVGDGVNDIPLAKEAGLSIAFNARPELQKVCTHSINQGTKDLRGILDYL